MYNSLPESNENTFLINLQVAGINEVNSHANYSRLNFIIFLSSVFNSKHLAQTISDWFWSQTDPGTFLGHFESSDLDSESRVRVKHHSL